MCTDLILGLSFFLFALLWWDNFTLKKDTSEVGALVKARAVATCILMVSLYLKFFIQNIYVLCNVID
jgi:hypothetical protein